MQLRHLFLHLTIAGLIALTATFSRADDLDALAPFIDDNTVAVVSVDLTHIDLAGLQDQYLDPILKNEADRHEASTAVKEVDDWLKRFRADGVRQIYLVLTVAHFPQLSPKHLNHNLATKIPFVVIPGAKTKALRELHQKFEPLNKQARQARSGNGDPDPTISSGQIHEVGVIAFDTLFSQLTLQQPKPRPDISKSLAAAGDRPIRVAIVPPPYFSRAAEEILLEPLPGTNEPLGPILARGAKWASLGINPDIDQFSAQLVVQSADAQAAKKLADTLNLAATLLSDALADESQFQAIMSSAFLTTLLPTAEGDQLVLSINQQRAAAMHQIANGVLKFVRADARRSQSVNNLKQIALALHNYHSAKKQFPDRAIRDKDGKPLLSWRVAILPYIEEKALYDQFHLDEPWDSEHNRKLLSVIPSVYQSPDTAQSPPTKTRYLAPTGDSLAFPPDRGISVREFNDGTSKTIMLVEADADHAVIWTKPDDIEIDLNDPKRGLTEGKKTFNAARADGSVHVIPGNIDIETLRRLFTRNDGESVE